MLNLRQLLNGIYDRSGYGFVIDYKQPAVPALAEPDLRWISQWLKPGRTD